MEQILVNQDVDPATGLPLESGASRANAEAGRDCRKRSTDERQELIAANGRIDTQNRNVDKTF